MNSDAFYGSPRKRVHGLLSVVCRLSPAEMEIVREISPPLSSLPGRSLAGEEERRRFDCDREEWVGYKRVTGF